MPATASAEEDAGGRRRLGVLVDVLALALMGCCFVWMVFDQELRSIPYHLIFFTLIVVYGFRVWSLAATVLVLAVVIVTTGGVWTAQHLRGELEAGEFFEVVLMPMILVAMVWHARRRASSERRLAANLHAASDRADAESQFLRDAAHALRNPVAVARGFLDLAELGDPDDSADLPDAVRRELSRVDRIAGQLLDVAAHPDGDLAQRVTLDAAGLAGAAVARWRGVAARDWVLDVAGPAQVDAVPERLADALDALLDNAVRFTARGDRIRVVCRAQGSVVELGVADAGPGIPAGSTGAAFDRFWRTPAPDGSRGTGLGLAFVATVAGECGGRADAVVADEGGAYVRLVLPLAPAVADGPYPGPTTGTDLVEPVGRPSGPRATTVWLDTLRGRLGPDRRPDQEPVRASDSTTR